MKNLFKSFLLLLLFFALYQSQAQYVVIPDANFRAFLKERYPSCLNAADEMDTTCSSIKNVNWLYCPSRNIQNFDGVQYFTGLKEFDCGSNQAISLPRLPASLTALRCYQNKFTVLPDLPEKLTFLDCSTNLLTSLPQLPSSLIVLVCNGNQLSVLPALPAGLTDLYVTRNLFTSLPVLPAALKTLYCDFNQLTVLPALPVGMKDLYCQYNELTSLPVLPSGLINLWCMNNNLSSLPALPTTLDVLFCNDNKITVLPVLSNSITQFMCNGNLLTSLPALPTHVRVFYCQYNLITSLPALPQSLMYLNCSSNKLTSLPVLPDNMTVLQCNSNKITALPELPATVTELHCNENLLSSLPVLPAGLRVLGCGNNKFTSLPELSPALIKLECSSNQLTFLPQLPSGLQDLSCFNNRLTALPALPQTLSFVYANSNCFITIPVNPNPAGIYLFLVSPNSSACVTPPVIQTQPVNTTVCPGAGATFTVSATGSSLTYRWQEDSGTGVFVDLISNTTFQNTTTPTLILSSALSLNGHRYRCEITSGSATVYSDPALLNVTPVIISILQVQPVTCKGLSTGSVRSTVSGGGLPYSYVWNTGATTDRILNQPAGTYTVTVTDANNCSVVQSAVITEPAAVLTASVNSTNVLCKGAFNGTAIITAVGGTVPYRYAWSTGATTATISNLAAGSYVADVTDATGCSSSKSAVITEPSTAIAAPSVVSPVILTLGSSATALTATGTSLKWYITATGGTGVSAAPIPSTTAAGAISYYVSQTVAGCEGSRARIDVSVIEDGDIFGTSCFVLGQTYSFELNPKYKTNATYYNWWVNGSVQNINPRSAATVTSISVGQYYISGEVCVGINYSQAPWYRQFCRKVELCPHTLRETSVISSEEKTPSELLTIYPNPSSGYINVQAHTDIEQIRIVTMLGEVVVSFTEVLENQTILLGQDLSAGMYILQYQVKNGDNYTSPIIKQ